MRARLFPVLLAFALAACAGGPPPGDGATTATASVAPALARPAIDVAQLIGLDATALERALGLPGLKRTDPPAQIWQYTRTTCTVNVFLYTDGNGGAHRVEHIEAHDKAGADTDAARCLGEAAAS